METHTSWCQGHSWRAASRMGSWAGALEEVKLERVLQETRPVLLPFSTHFAWVVLALPYPQELCGVFQGVPELHLVITHGAPHDNSRRCCTWCRHAYGLLCLGTHMACGLFRVKQPKQTRHVLATWRRCHKCTLASLALWRSRRWASQRARLWKVSCTPLSLHECTLTLEPPFCNQCAPRLAGRWTLPPRCWHPRGNKAHQQSCQVIVKQGCTPAPPRLAPCPLDSFAPLLICCCA